MPSESSTSALRSAEWSKTSHRAGKARRIPGESQERQDTPPVDKDTVLSAKQENGKGHPKTGSGKRMPPLRELMHRLRKRDLDLLQAIYINRAISYRQAYAAFWAPRRQNEAGTLSEPTQTCQQRLRLLRDYGLIEIGRITSQESKSLIVTLESEHPKPDLKPWGKMLTLKSKGVKALVSAGRVAAEVLDDLPEGELDPEALRERKKLARQVKAAGKPTERSTDHTLMTAELGLRVFADCPERLNWVGTRHLVKVIGEATGPHGEVEKSDVIPDAMFASEFKAWAVEIDTGTIEWQKLSNRWHKALPLWERLIGQQLKNLPDVYPGSPVEGVLWFCAGPTQERLLNRLVRLRKTVLKESTLHPNLSWYVDTFEGLAWTWKHFLWPWTMDPLNYSSPADLLARTIKGIYGDFKIEAYAVLGNMSAWQRVDGWITRKSMRHDEPACFVLVRDEVERDGLWERALERRVQKDVVFLIPDPEQPLPLTRGTLWVRDDENLPWRQAPFARPQGGGSR